MKCRLAAGSSVSSVVAACANAVVAAAFCFRGRPRGFGGVAGFGLGFGLKNDVITPSFFQFGDAFLSFDMINASNKGCT